MRQPRLLAAGALVMAAPLAACGAGSAGLRASATRTGSSSLTVATTASPRPDGAVYIEGAFAEVRLRAPDGRVIGTKRTYPGRRVVFRGLPSGRYTLEPAMRPCDGNCSELDPRTDGCRGVVPVVGPAAVTVRFVVGMPCSVGPVRSPTADR